MRAIDTLVRENILKMKAYSCARDEYKGAEAIFLDANENPYGINNRYPDPYQVEIKNKLAELKGVDPTEIFLGNGSDEVIDLAFRIFCKPGQDKVVVFTPTYGMYEVSAETNDVQVIRIPLNDQFQIEKGSYEFVLSDPAIKIAFICTPNNPTGNSMDRETVRDLIERFNGIVFIDEAYVDFSNDASWLSVIRGAGNVIVSQTFSKAWGLAGIRVGVAYASRQILSWYNKVKPPYNISSLNQQEVLKALSQKEKMQQQVDEIKANKLVLMQQISQLKFVKNLFPTEANFLFVEVSDADKIYHALVSQKIITRNRNAVVKNCIRITVGTVEENEKLMNELLKIDRVEQGIEDVKLN